MPTLDTCCPHSSPPVARHAGAGHSPAYRPLLVLREAIPVSRRSALVALLAGALAGIAWTAVETSVARHANVPRAAVASRADVTDTPAR